MSVANTTTLIEQYSSLSPSERQTLQVLAFFKMPIARSPFISCLQRAGIRLGGGKTITLPEITLLFDTFVAQKLAVVTMGSYSCPLLVQNDLIAMAAEEGQLKQFMEAVEPLIRKAYYRDLDDALQNLRPNSCVITSLSASKVSGSTKAPLATPSRLPSGFSASGTRRATGLPLRAITTSPSLQSE